MADNPVEIKKGRRFAVEVELESTKPVYSFGVTVVYDPTLAEFVQEGIEWLENALKQSGAVENVSLENDQPGRLVIGVSLTGDPSKAQSGVFPILRIPFLALSEGLGSIYVEQVGLYIVDENGEVVEVPASRIERQLPPGFKIIAEVTDHYVIRLKIVQVEEVS